MNREQPFQPSDLNELDQLLSEAHAVIPIREIHAGNHTTDTIGLRHDVDNRNGAFDTALRMAHWEAERGYRSTYYLLHTADYWQRKGFDYLVHEIAALGHEIGLHANAIAESLRTGRDPHAILEDALEELDSWGFAVRGTVGHGDKLCHTARFANAEQFTEYTRPDYGDPDRTLNNYDGLALINTLTLKPRPLADFGLDYEATLVTRPTNTDSSGRWYHAWDETVTTWDALQAAGPARKAARKLGGQISLLIHPDWWGEAFQ